MQYQGQTIPTQEAPPRPGPLMATAVPLEGSRTSHGIEGGGGQCNARLATLQTGEVNRDLRPLKSKAQQHRAPTTRQRTLWKSVRQAKLRRLSLRAIARDLGIHRNTVRKYALTDSAQGLSSDVERRRSPRHSPQLRVQPVHQRLGLQGLLRGHRG